MINPQQPDYDFGLTKSVQYQPTKPVGDEELDDCLETFGYEYTAAKTPAEVSQATKYAKQALVTWSDKRIAAQQGQSNADVVNEIINVLQDAVTIEVGTNIRPLAEKLASVAAHQPQPVADEELRQAIKDELSHTYYRGLDKQGWPQHDENRAITRLLQLIAARDQQKTEDIRKAIQTRVDSGKYVARRSTDNPPGWEHALWTEDIWQAIQTIMDGKSEEREDESKTAN